MKISTPEGIKDAEPLEFSLEEAERPIKLILADGTVLFCRATIASVARYLDNDGNLQYGVNTMLSVVKIN